MISLNLLDVQSELHVLKNIAYINSRIGYTALNFDRKGECTKNLEKAESAEEVDTLMEAFWKALSKTETKDQKLEKAREKAKYEISEFSTGAYDEDGAAQIARLQKKYIGKVNAADTTKQVKQAVREFEKAAAAVKKEAQLREKASREAEKEKEQNAGPFVKPTKAVAQKYVGSDMSALIAVIGSPSSRNYA